jgi:hypothetical protein
MHMRADDRSSSVRKESRIPRARPMYRAQPHFRIAHVGQSLFRIRVPLPPVMV